MRDPTRRLITTAILLGAVLTRATPTAAQASAYAPTYLDPVDLGTLGGNETRAYDAYRARIVGASQTVDGTVHAFKYETGVLTDLGTLGGSTSWAFAINAAGAVVGSASLPGDVAAHAFLWTEDRGMLDLGTLGGTSSRASGINDAGRVSGWSQVAGDNSYHAFLWDPTSGMRDLGTFGGNSSAAYDVADFACGEAETTDGSRHAFITSDDDLIDLGTLGGTYSAAIKCSGQRPLGPRLILGESSVSDDSATHAVGWDSRLSITDLGTLGGKESRALRESADRGPSGGLFEIFGESRTVEGDLHPARWMSRPFEPIQIADFAHVLGADSQIELVGLVGGGDLRNKVVSGAAYPGADVHAYIVSVPRAFEPSVPRTIDDGVIEVLAVTGRAHIAFTTEDATADLGVGEGFYRGCWPCRAGSTLNLSQQNLVTDAGSGSATVRGNEYRSIYMPYVNFTIPADPIIVPTTGEEWLTLSTPFTYSGFVLGALRTGFVRSPADELFGVSLRGAGTATIQLFSADGGRTYIQRELKYVFERP